SKAHIFFFFLNKKISQKIIIVSDNDDKSDREWLTKEFDKSEIDFEFAGFNFSKKYDENCTLFAFGTKFPFSNRIWIEGFAGKEVLILSKREYEEFRRISFYTEKIIKLITSSKRRKTILNLEENSDLVFMNKVFKIQLPNLEEYGKIKEIEKELERVNLYTDDIFEFINTDILNNKEKNRDKFNTQNSDNIFIYFEDGTYEVVKSNQIFYLSIESDETEISDISQLRIKAQELKVGDEIIIFNKGNYDEFVDVVDEKIKSDPQLNKYYLISESWRVLLNDLLKKYDYDYDFVAIKLKRTINIKRTPQTIKNWANGYTRVPDKFEEVLIGLKTLSQEPALKEMHNLDRIIKYATKFKSYYSKIPSQLRYLVTSKKYEIPLVIDEDFKSVVMKLEKEIEIKKIKLIH
ncbi:MAG: hypothetical protein KDC67_00765, partial [Ignavibacteriae bacterium]|nr:hypothetical protein [Ignavibacteriota bacterium]